MKKIIVATVVAVLLVEVAVATKRPAMQTTTTVLADQGTRCSVGSVAGDYGFTLTGTLILPTGLVPAAAIGRAKLDAAGNVSGAEARNVGGGFANETFTGTTTVNPDCTGTSTLHFYESGNLVRTSMIAIVWDDSANEFRLVQQSLVLPDDAHVPVIVTGEARKISPNTGE